MASIIMYFFVDVGLLGSAGWFEWDGIRADSRSKFWKVEGILS